MLGKLIKEEFKATRRVFLLLLALLLGASLSVSLFFYPWVSRNTRYALDTSSVSGLERMSEWLALISLIVYVVVIIASIVVAFVVIIQRFYKSLLGDEGYLMFTLPVPNWQHVVAKGLVAMVWLFIAAVVGFLSAIIMTRSFSLLPKALTAFHEYVQNTSQELAVPYLWILVQWVLMVFFATTRWLLLIYGAIALGHLWTNHRLLGAFLSYLVFQIATSFLTGVSRYGVGEYILSSGNFRMYQTSYAIMGGNIVFNFLLSVVFFVLVTYILTKHLNLE